MSMYRSLGFIAAALMAAGGTTAFCFRDALAKGPSEDGAIAAAPANAPSRPLEVLHDARPWLSGTDGTAPSLRGKVIVVNFWTHSCINSLRALPYLRAWDARYRDRGLEVIGVHAPEFGFEHDPAKVRAAIAALGVRYPNVQDNDYSVWSAFDNEGWPGFYFIDATGKVRGYTLGEGNYAEAEQLIRKLLAEAGHNTSDIPLSPITGTGAEAEADWPSLRSPESYIGYAKAQGFASPGGFQRDRASAYASASLLALNRWDLSGDWTVTGEYARTEKPGGAIRFHFHARDAHLVLGAPADGQPVRFRVTVDGAAPGADHGADTDAAGWGEVRQDRLYQLVRQHGAISGRTVRVEFSRPGVRAYSFTFG